MKHEVYYSLALAALSPAWLVLLILSPSPPPSLPLTPSNRVYMGGRYFLGLGKEFVIYPTTSITIELFDIPAATKDKQTVYLDLAIQYRLKPER